MDTPNLCDDRRHNDTGLPDTNDLAGWQAYAEQHPVYIPSVSETDWDPDVAEQLMQEWLMEQYAKKQGKR